MKYPFAALVLWLPALAATAQPSHEGHGGHAMPAATTNSSEPAVGSLPSSDGSGPQTYAQYGIHPHMLDDAVSWRLGFEKFGLAQGRGDLSAAQWDGQFWTGTDRNKLVIESEGDRARGRSDAFAQAFWSHAISAYWDLQLGGRRDFGTDAKRNWAAFGVAGVLPYNIELQATAYVGESGRTALRMKADYDFLITQRLILTPEVEAMAYGRADPARATGAGLADANLSLQLRYEVTRQFAPYVGFSIGRKFGATATMADGESVSERAWLLGVRFWF